MEDAAMFFAHVFGGERFKDYIGEISLMKEMTSVAHTVASDEEREELEKEGIIPPSTSAQERVPTPPMTPVADSSGQTPRHFDTSAVALKASASSEDTSKRTVTPDDSSPAKNGSKSVPTSPLHEKDRDSHTSKKHSRLTPEQKKKLHELEEERRKALEERVKSLTTKLVERLRPLVEAKHPGDKDDPETKTFQEKVKLEAEDLKLESFGVELLHAIGTVYSVKATSFLKSKKFLGLGGFWSRIKEKGSVAKDAWGVIGSALSVQSLMQEMERLQAKGEVNEDILHAMEEDMTGKILLASWRGTRFEVVQVLREPLTFIRLWTTSSKTAKPLIKYFSTGPRYDDKTTPVAYLLTEQVKGLLIIGHIFKNTVPDESDEDRRELERYAYATAPLDKSDLYAFSTSMVAEAAAGKSKHQQLRAQTRGHYKHTPHKEPADQTEEAASQPS
ncbi:X-domain of DnaJ-containing-domain-containing protein [Boletus reticuloceps]|uniref:X-domain of DnaJ-containing-domain-containing protein n=1 Tax=Boletus reticuloceps TaxID=495285 RepID=A0A8I3ADM9_9AGAM|nr:X-domain of DnaJ-containing-domain-containing protein [Boletus reticuloceps]